MGFAVHIEHRAARVGAEADRTGLVGRGRDVHALVEVHPTLVGLLVEAEIGQHGIELLAHARETFGVVVPGQGQVHGAVLVDGETAVGAGQILR